METLDELVSAGKVRVLGCSNETSWGLMKSIEASERNGFARYRTIQNNFSLNNRRFEDELAQVCRHEGVSLIPYSPLAGGVLSGKYDGGATPEGARFSSYLKMGGRQAAMAHRSLNERSLEATRRFAIIAAEAGVAPVTLAIAWSKKNNIASLHRRSSGSHKRISFPTSWPLPIWSWSKTSWPRSTACRKRFCIRWDRSREPSLAAGSAKGEAMPRFILTLTLVGMFCTAPTVQAAEISVGDAAPEFTLQGTDGKENRLSDYKGKQEVVLAWFPKAFTSG
jgi:hypothetical protein